MDLTQTINNLIAGQQSAYVAGLLAAITPCVLALIPIFLYRFGVWGKDEMPQLSTTGSRLSQAGELLVHWWLPGLWKVLRQILPVILGFLGSFILSGVVFQQLLRSDFVNVTRLLLANILIIVGLLQLTGIVSFNAVSQATNPLVLGIVLPWIISFSPCVLPFLTVILAGSTVTGEALGSFVLFALGLLTPPIVIALLGNRALALFKQSRRLLNVVERWSALLLILAGIYISSTLVQVTSSDVWISGLLLLGVLLIMSVTVWRYISRRTVQNLVLFAIAAVVIASVTLYLGNLAAVHQTVLTDGEFVLTCLENNGHIACEACGTVATLFALASAVVAGVQVLSQRPGKQIKFLLPRR